jgi:hypothetical protein
MEDVEEAGLPLTVGLRMENVFAEGNHQCQWKIAEYRDVIYSIAALSLCCSSLSRPSIETSNQLLSHSTLDLHGILLFLTANKYSKHFSNFLGICINTFLDIIFIQCFKLPKQP